MAVKINDDGPGVMNMNVKCVRQASVLVLLLACAMSANADDRSDYNRRAATRDLSLFHSLDLNADGMVTRLEAQGDVNFLPRFGYMEMNMDGVVTLDEVQRYVERQYGARNTARRP